MNPYDKNKVGPQRSSEIFTLSTQESRELDLCFSVDLIESDFHCKENKSPKKSADIHGDTAPAVGELPQESNGIGSSCTGMPLSTAWRKRNRLSLRPASHVQENQDRTPVPSSSSSKKGSPSVQSSTASPSFEILKVSDNTLVSALPEKGRISLSSCRRIIPGPAGLLADLDREEAQRSTCVGDLSIYPPWNLMQKDLEGKAAEIAKEFTVLDVLTKAQKKQLAQSRVPKMCLLLDSIDDSTADASAVFTDLTGSMHGSIHRQILKDHQKHLISGSVFVFKKVAIFTPSRQKHSYLNITPANLVRIYLKPSQDQSQNTCITLSKFYPQDFMQSAHFTVS